MKKETLSNFETPRILGEFKKYLRERKKESQADLKILAEEFNIEIEILQKIRNEIREIIGEDTEYLSTTIHLRPRAISFLELGEKRIKEVVEEKTFHYPVYYQKFSEERPDIIDIGKIRISLLEAIPELKNKKFEYSIDFHEALMEYLNNQNWEEELEKNLKEYLYSKFSNIPKKIREIFIGFIIPSIVEILQNYKKFFEKFKLNNKEKIKEFNSKICNILLNNFDKLEKILNRLGLTKERLEDIQKREEFIIGSDIIFLICILGGYIHIGAEYGKLNALRKNLGLEEIVEAETPQERFNLFGVKDIESGTLKFLFENPEPFIYACIYSGLEEFSSSPIDNKVRERIRVVDFYYKLKDFNLDKILKEEPLDKEEFKEVLGIIDYFSHLDDKEKEIIRKKIDEIDGDKISLAKWIEIFNKFIENTEIRGRGFIYEHVLKSKLVILVFKKYVENLLFDLMLPNNIKNKIIEEFCNRQILERTLNRETGSFGGLYPKLTIPDFKQEDMVNLSILFALAEEKIATKEAINFTSKLLEILKK